MAASRTVQNESNRYFLHQHETCIIPVLNIVFDISCYISYFESLFDITGVTVGCSKTGPSEKIDQTKESAD